MQRSTIVGFVGGETREETRNRIYLETVEKEWTNLKLNRKKKESKGILKDYGKKKKLNENVNKYVIYAINEVAYDGVDWKKCG